jgi:hypothetical protein
VGQSGQVLGREGRVIGREKPGHSGRTHLFWKRSRGGLYQPAEILTRARMLRVEQGSHIPLDRRTFLQWLSRWWRGQHESESQSSSIIAQMLVVYLSRVVGAKLEQAT